MIAKTETNIQEGCFSSYYQSVKILISSKDSDFFVPKEINSLWSSEDIENFCGI